MKMVLVVVACVVIETLYAQVLYFEYEDIKKVFLRVDLYVVTLMLLSLISAVAAL